MLATRAGTCRCGPIGGRMAIAVPPIARARCARALLHPHRSRPLPAPRAAAAAAAATLAAAAATPVVADIAAAAAAADLLLPPQYGFVLASLASTAALLQFLAVRVALARRTYGVDYPRVYADDGTEGGRIFDCTQRAHQNTLETAPAQMVLIALLGVAHPIPAAAAQFVWVGGRVVYALGYSTGDPGARLPGVAISGLVYAATILASLVEAGRMVLSS